MNEKLFLDFLKKLKFYNDKEDMFIPLDLLAEIGKRSLNIFIENMLSTYYDKADFSLQWSPSVQDAIKILAECVISTYYKIGRKLRKRSRS